MNVVSLFDGMSCGRVALQRAGFRYVNYFASEIEKQAIKVASDNWPDTKHIGDVTKIKYIDWSIDTPDLLIGGSPCQGFSFAGKQLNFDDPRSKLFFEFVRILNEIRKVNPNVKFLLENVRMKKAYQDVITEALGVKPVEVNSALVSAQSRKRLYWTNIEGFKMPEDRHIYLSDILEEEYDYSTGAAIRGQYSNRKERTVETRLDISKDQKSNCLTPGFSNRLNLVLCGSIRGRHIVDGKRVDHKMKTAGLAKQRLEIRTDGKSGTITTVGKDNVVVFNPDKKYYDLDDVLIIKDGSKKGFAEILPGECFDATRPNSDTMRGRVMTEKAHCVKPKKEFSQYMGKTTVRPFTITEYERLQTLPDGYTGSVSKSAAKKMIGNGWTVDVIVEFLKPLLPLFNQEPAPVASFDEIIEF